jgi:hypothetical protein
MRRALLGWVVGIGLACGSGTPEDAAAPAQPAGAEANRPPYVESIGIVPAEPTAEDALSVGLRVLDPDHDALDVSLSWYRNGAVHDASGRQTIDPGEFSRGDSIWAEAVISDGQHEIEVRSDAVTIANAPPRPSAVRITPPEPSTADMLEVQIAGDDADGDPVRWSYRWAVNGAPVDGAQGPRLAPGALARGARVAVEVSGNDGIEDGEWVSSDPVFIANAKPKITTQPVYGLASPGRYVYEVKAEDADGDQPLRFELTEGPPGMAIDLVSGVVSWQLPADAKGSYPVEIAVSDAHGGRSAQRWSLDVSWEPEPDKPVRAKATAAGGESASSAASADGDQTEAADSGADAPDDEADEVDDDDESADTEDEEL